MVEYMKQLRECKQVNLEELNLVFDFKHADYILDCGDLVVVIEETSRSKLEDLDKIDNTIKWLLQHRSQGYRELVGIIHRFRSVSSLLALALKTRMQSSRRLGIPVTYSIATCEDHLKRILSERGIYTVR